MATPTTTNPRLKFTQALRERFLGEASKAMVEIGAAVDAQLVVVMDSPGSARANQSRRDAWMAFKKCRPVWIEGTTSSWKECLLPSKNRKSIASSKDLSNSLELVGTDEVESKILASRMVLSVAEKVHSELEDLRVRVQFLESTEDLDGGDIFRPEVLIHLLIEQWGKSGMPGDAWPSVSEVVQKLLIERLKAAYADANDVMIKKGVMPVIELKDRVKAVRKSASARPAPGGSGSAGADAQNAGDVGPSGFGNPFAQPAAGYPAQYPGQGRGPAQSQAPYQEPQPGGYPPEEPQRPSAGFFGGKLGWGSRQGTSAPPGADSAGAPASGGGSSSGQTPFWKQGAGGQSRPGQAYGGHDETRMMTNNTPLARARSRAQGVIGQIRRLFVSYGGGDFASSSHQPQPRSAALAAAIAPPQPGQVMYAAGGTMYEDYSPAGVARVAGNLREKSDELKKKAETKGEKATIEIVALMFQAILAEERIPPGIRVWFARLQMPVLRLALEDPEFFGTTTHPARLLIDRMGSCVMGFDAAGVQGNAMELEIKRIVQVIEQYPETGKKVYQIVYEEFQKFLAKYLTEQGSNQKVVSVAQQVEQKETLAIQYTIEMRNMLKDLPVRDEIRDYLFKVWAEVLAVAAVRKGPQHADTLLLKKSATDLVWAASAKPNRADRAKVIQELPNLLLRLRSGMSLLALPPSEQEAHIKKVSDTLADAFLSKTQAIPQAKIDALAQRLGNLEDFVSEDGLGDLPLDAESIEMMLGIDASAIEVVANGGSKPTAAMLAWAQELQVGSWFTLDHNKQMNHVQFSWRSDRKHLNLFASSSGKSFLIQAGRLAAYLQAGLLLPQEEEGLTVRATRDALTKLEANPERILA
jgi:hypothetical protein